jgi:SPP1 gp7 family putative phage head morphogenesis protein
MKEGYFMGIFKKIFGNKNTARTNSEPKTWREASIKATKGNEMYKEIKKELDYSLYEKIYKKVKNNYMIMKFFPENIPKNIVYHVINEHFKGRRPESICEDIQNKFFDISNKDMRKITFTICSACSASFNQNRSQDLGLNWYIWRTAGDSKVRKSHRKMDGLVINFNEPPSPERLVGEPFIGEYNAGECDGCRCYAESVVNIDFVKFPRRVYYNGKIQVMKKAEFMKIYKGS